MSRPMGGGAVKRGFEAFYEQQYGSVVALAYAVSGSWAVAEEVAQEAFLRAYRDWDRVGGFEFPDRWVRRVAVNLARSVWRRVRAEARAMARLSGRAADPTWDIDVPAVRFWEQVRSLPRRQAQVVALHYLEDRSIADIADLLGISEGAVKGSLHKGRRSLAAKLDQEVGP